MQSNQSAVKSAFENLKNAFSSGQAIAPVRELIGETDIDTAYAVQEKLVAHFIDQGARKVGIKIGLTSESVQKQLGVNQPDFGVLFAHTHLPNNGKIPFSFLIQPKAEAEMAFVLKESITPTGSSYFGIAIQNRVRVCRHRNCRVKGGKLEYPHHRYRSRQCLGLSFCLGGSPCRTGSN